MNTMQVETLVTNYLAGCETATVTELVEQYGVKVYVAIDALVGMAVVEFDDNGNVRLK